MNNKQKALDLINAYLEKQNKTKLATQKIELAGEIENLLKYEKGVNEFGKNINIDLKELEEIRISLEVDIENLTEDLNKVERGIKMADKAASDLGISPSSIPLYNEAKAALDFGQKQISKGKKEL